LDGKLKTQLEEMANVAPRGWILQENDYFEVKGQDFRPLTRCFRGMSRPMRSFSIDQLKPTGTKLPIGGRLCDQFILKRTGGDWDEFWLDPARDWVLVREVYIRPKTTHTQLDITYEPSSICGWVPKSWEFRHTKNETVPFSTENYVVTNYRLNEAISESEFGLTFPTGTNVLDYSNRNAPKQFVTTNDTVQTLTIETEHNWTKWLYGVGVLAVIVGLGVYWVRRRRRSNPVSSIE
jgi:hypothetical protein